MDNEKKHTLEIAALVTGWLNSASGKPVNPKHSDMPPRPAYKDALAFLDQVKAGDTDAINAALARHPVKRIAMGDGSFDWFPTKGLDEQAREFGKGPILQWICDLAERGALDSLKQCQADGRWFVAQRSNQAHCSIACRRRHHETSDEFKAHRRGYMRGYYALQKKGVTK
jgi:hypothetical protein